MSITVPPILENTQSAFDIIQTVLSADPKQIKKIEESIKEYHALNDTEKKKAAEARELIIQHQKVLSEINNATLRLTEDKDSLGKERQQFIAERQSKLDDIAVKHHELNTEKDALINEQRAMQAQIKQIAVAQAAIENVTKGHTEKEDSLSRKEQDMNQKEQDLALREAKVRMAEDQVNHKFVKLRQIME